MSFLYDLETIKADVYDHLRENFMQKAIPVYENYFNNFKVVSMTDTLSKRSPYMNMILMRITYEANGLQMVMSIRLCNYSLKKNNVCWHHPTKFEILDEVVENLETFNSKVASPIISKLVVDKLVQLGVHSRLSNEELDAIHMHARKILFDHKYYLLLSKSTFYSLNEKIGNSIDCYVNTDSFKKRLQEEISNDISKYANALVSVCLEFGYDLDDIKKSVDHEFVKNVQEK